MKLSTSIHRVDLLCARDRLEMFHLHSRYYENLQKRVFMADLEEKQWAILLRTADGRLGGFSTVQRIDLEIAGQSHRFLFSGDTIVDPRYWFESSLAGAFGQLMMHEIDSWDNENLHWFLICKGFRTYRFLPVYFREFYPRFDRPTPREAGVILDAIARHKFPESYDCDSGLIRLEGAKDRLCNRLCSVPEGRAMNPHVAYFLQRNPLYSHGDELACLAEISMSNLKQSARRVLDRCEVEWCA